MSQDALDRLKQASAGLLYPSESDEPFDVFRWSAQGKDTAGEQIAAHGGKGRKIEEIAVNLFFRELEDADDAERFKQLRQAAEASLTELKVFRIGSVRIDVYLIGRTHSGEWAGLHTVSVET